MTQMRDFWQDRRVFVTGCTGLVGVWTVRALLQRGAHVVGLVRDRVAGSELFRTGLAQRMDLVRGCVEDERLIERALAEYEIQTIFHLAAQTIVGIANRSPLSTFESNIKGTWCVLEAARRCGFQPQVIVASSDKAYGDQNILPYTEDAPLQGRHPYDVSKSCADLIALSYAHTYRLPVCVTRCGNFFGGWRPQFQPHRARHHSECHSWRAAIASLRWLVGPRLFLRPRRRRRLSPSGGVSGQGRVAERRGIQLFH
jgi:CDP-glucose 4,6-dehydratase